MIKPCVPSQLAYGHVHTVQPVCAKLSGQYSTGKGTTEKANTGV